MHVTRCAIHVIRYCKIMALITEHRDRQKNRLTGYDYAQDGLYFVTICVKNRVECFGDVQDDRMILNKNGYIVHRQWLWLSKQYQYIKLDAFIVMPNHFHGVIIIDQRRDRSRPVPTDADPPVVPTRPVPTDTDPPVVPTRPVPTDAARRVKSLSELIGAFKTTSSKKIHQNGLLNFAWQRSFYDNIIRDEQALHNIREYIKQNPANWSRDRNNPLNFIGRDARPRR